MCKVLDKGSRLGLSLATVNNPEENTGRHDTDGQRNIGTELEHNLEISGGDDYSKGKDRT